MNGDQGDPLKLALLLEGGAMRAGFVAGAAMALMDNNIVDFDMALAVSASIPTLAYFLSGQREALESVWREELCTPRLVCYRNLPACSLALSGTRPVLDIDYLVDEVFRKKYPLDTRRLARSGTDASFAVTVVPEGRVDFLGPEDGDIYDIFRAGLAVPGLYPHPVRLGEREFVDGGTVNPIPASVLSGKQDVRILAILTKPLDCENEPPTILERALFWRYFHRHEWMVEKLWEAAQAHNEEVTRLERLACRNPPETLIIAPERLPPARFITRDRRKINRTINMGYRAVSRRLDEIAAFTRARAAP